MDEYDVAKYELPSNIVKLDFTFSVIYVDIFRGLLLLIFGELVVGRFVVENIWEGYGGDVSGVSFSATITAWVVVGGGDWMEWFWFWYWFWG